MAIEIDMKFKLKFKINFPPINKPKNRNNVNKKPMYACPECNTAWEVYKHKHLEYQDFPKYKLEKKVCPKCQ